jgi:hypothetical protein
MLWNTPIQSYIMDPGQMFSLEEIFIDALWIIGIAGVLATLSYMGWYRSAKRLTWRRLFSLPRMLKFSVLALRSVGCWWRRRHPGGKRLPGVRSWSYLPFKLLPTVLPVHATVGIHR